MAYTKSSQLRKMNHTTFISLTLITFLISTTFTQTSSNTMLNLTTDHQALLAFKNTIISDPTGILATAWSTTTSVCHWTGVSCGTKHQRITALNISGYALAGNLVPHLGNLTFLRSLNISSNNFTGFIPYELSNLRRLEYINVGFNNFAGEIPSWFGALPRLQYVDMRNNTLSGKIPSSLFNVSSLIEINLRFNRLSGKLPNDTCSNTPNLEALYLSGNQIEGEITGNIYKCRELRDVRLSYNHLQGSIPKQFGNLTSLISIDLAYNRFAGELPMELGNLAQLQVFAAPFIDFLSGFIPSSIFNISTLNTLALQQNNFSGTLPPTMGLSLFNLQYLYLYYNKIGGSIPVSITNASELTVLELNRNTFTGPIPDLGYLKYLHVLRLWENNLTGTEFLTSLMNCPYMEVLEVSYNPLNGVIPSSIGNLSTSLNHIAASNCKIKGFIPSTIVNLSSLVGLYPHENEVKGFIPMNIGKLKQLQRLYLGSNQVEGYIPNDLCKLGLLLQMNLSDNLLTGPVHGCLGKLRNLRELYFDKNNLNSTVPSDLWNLTSLLALNLSSNYLSGELSSQVGSLKGMYQLDLSYNRFSGNISSSIGSCISLEFLSLSNNMFGGSIPQSLGLVRTLNTLDLSRNNLSGFIPKSLENLTLEDFDVSYNELEGDIPNGGCFVNFSAESFAHNFNLCGDARFRVPPCMKRDAKTRSNRIVKLMKYILPPLILSVIVVAVVVILVQRRKTTKKQPSDDVAALGVSWRRVSYIELVRGTDSFDETSLLGRGSFGSVFKATLSDGLIVAVKVFNLQSESATKSFKNESRILSGIRHRNLLRITGCCTNMEFKALILEFMPNGSLDKWLHSEELCLDLTQRVDVALDVASALEYLNHGYTFPVVHCDIKPSNVLLDEDMNARVGDFGIAKLFEDGETLVLTNTLATIGYAAPEYGSEGKVSTQGDIYSYGILLLEMFTTKKPTDEMFGGEMSLREWVNEALQENAGSEIMDPRLLPNIEDRHFIEMVQCVSSIFGLAMKCLAISPQERINMVEVVAALKKIRVAFLPRTRR